MLLFFTLSTFLMMTMSPMKVSFWVMISSIMSGVVSYSISMSLFPPSAVMISFSSGMMILFCYCAMMSPHESKSKKKKMMMLLLTLWATTASFSDNEIINNSTNSKIVMNTSMPFLIMALSVILISMCSINKSMFSPTKSLSLMY